MGITMKIGLHFLGICAVSATFSLAACAPSAKTDDDADGAAISEADLGADDDLQSFSTYDATDAELAEAQPTAPPGDNELTLFAIPAPTLTGLSWKNPGGLARRTLISEGLGLHRALGHAAVRVQCAATAKEPAAHFEGSVIDTDDTFRNMVLKQKVGLGVLLHTVPGTLEPEPDLQATIDERYDNGRITFIRYAISADVCHGLVGYADALVKNNVTNAYGFVRPLYKEGAGCSAFSMGFLELANLEEANYRSDWGFDVNIPMGLIGGVDNPGNNVSVLKLFFTFSSWASESEPHRRLIGWDPTKMFTAIRSMAKNELKADHNTLSVEKRGKALGLVLDRRNVTPRAELTNRTYFAGEPNAPRNWWGFGDP